MEYTVSEVRKFAHEQVVGKNFVGGLTTSQQTIINLLTEFGMQLLQKTAPPSKIVTGQFKEFERSLKTP